MGCLQTNRIEATPLIKPVGVSAISISVSLLNLFCCVVPIERSEPWDCNTHVHTAVQWQYNGQSKENGETLAANAQVVWVV